MEGGSTIVIILDSCFDMDDMAVILVIPLCPSSDDPVMMVPSIIIIIRITTYNSNGSGRCSRTHVSGTTQGSDDCKFVTQSADFPDAADGTAWYAMADETDACSIIRIRTPR